MSWRERFLNKIVCGDSAVLLKEIPANSINLIITSPPYYKQREYGIGIGNETKIDEYIDNISMIFKECVRIVRNDGSIVFNLGDKYENGNLLMIPYRFALEVLRRFPVKLVNIITWVKMNPTPRQFKRRLVSSTEPFFHFVKSDEYYYDVDSFMDMPFEESKKNRIGEKLGERYFELIKEAPLTEDEKVKAREELAKVIGEVVEGKINSFRMKIRGIHKPAFGGQEGGRQIQLLKQGFTIIRILGEKLKRDVIECPVETIKSCPHPAVYPEFIIKELIKLLSRPKDIVLDPFVGSGTTAVAGKKLGRNYIGIDINAEYCKYAEERLKNLIHEPTFKEYFL